MHRNTPTQVHKDECVSRARMKMTLILLVCWSQYFRMLKQIFYNKCFHSYPLRFSPKVQEMPQLMGYVKRIGTFDTKAVSKFWLQTCLEYIQNLHTVYLAVFILQSPVRSESGLQLKELNSYGSVSRHRTTACRIC